VSYRWALTNEGIGPSRTFMIILETGTGIGLGPKDWTELIIIFDAVVARCGVPSMYKNGHLVIRKFGKDTTWESAKAQRH
jgi:hypothetical protein